MKRDILDISFDAVKGQFFPKQFSSQLYMDSDEISKNYLVEFHERFHYLQNIFTPYGHLKWGEHRSFTSDIINGWVEIARLTNKFKMPLNMYLNTDNKAVLGNMANLCVLDMTDQICNCLEFNNLPSYILKYCKVDKEEITPIVLIDDEKYKLNGIDIIEGYAKFEEALLGYIIESKDFNETINPDILDERYYIALYYFIENLGMERLHEFPIACELSLAFSKLPRINEMEILKKNHPAWRFIKIVDVLKKENVSDLNIFSNESFWEYTEDLLMKCEFDTWNKVWEPAKEYAKQADLSMAQEMTRAIEYKMKNPWALSYPMCDPEFFMGEEFNSFVPYFTITNDTVYYNTKNIDSTELVFENDFQAIALQLCGRISRRCIYPDMLQCGDSYFGMRSCKYFLYGVCDGHISEYSKVPELKFNENDDIVEGCLFKATLMAIGIDLSCLEIGDLRKKCTYKQIVDAYKGLKVLK